MKINLGCGNKRKDGYVGIDMFACDAVDIIANVAEGVPLADGTVTDVWMDNFIEHVPDIPRLMRELHRVCAPGARITAITPHYSSIASWRDPTHIHHLSYFSMDHFAKRGVAHYTGGGFRVERRKLSFGGGIMGLMGRLIFRISPAQWEAKWSFIFRAGTLHFELTVLK